mgnify:CR=1 FL=1
MVSSGGRFAGSELHAHRLGALREVVQHPLAIALLEVVLPRIGVLLTLGEHGVNQPSELVGRSRDRLGLVHARAQTPVVRPQRKRGQITIDSTRTQPPESARSQFPRSLYI